LEIPHAHAGERSGQGVPLPQGVVHLEGERAEGGERRESARETGRGREGRVRAREKGT